MGAGPHTRRKLLAKRVQTTLIPTSRCLKEVDTFRHAYLEKFHIFYGPKLSATKLKPHHVDRWVLADYKGQSAAHRKGAYRAVFRVMNWARKSGLVTYNPLVGMDTPTITPREFVIGAEQFQSILAIAKDKPFQDYLTFVWETGCRASEIRLIEAKHFDGEKIILEKTNSKGKRYNRVLYLTDRALEIVQRLVTKYPQGAIFRNKLGYPWRKNSVVCRFRRLKEKMNLPELCATTLRHSWATRQLKSGMDSTTASILMGHRDPATLQRNYQHLTQDHDYLKKAMRGAGTSS